MPAIKDHTLTYFPVGNGDTSLIKLSDGTTIVIDINACEPDGETERYDVHEHLLREVRVDSDGRPHLDAFILSHPDQDHVRGIERVFFLGDPAKYSQADKKANRIIIDELWFAPRIFRAQEDLCEDADSFKDEAERRKKIHATNAAGKGQAGNRLRVIGHTSNPDLKGVLDVTTTPGQTVDLVNGAKKDTFRFFVHGPQKKSTDDKFGDRNDTSIILQAQFDTDGVSRAALAIFGGDAGCSIWEFVVEKSDQYGNSAALEWDLLLAPHHCSWTFFSEESSDGGEASDIVLDLLDRCREGATVISSSKPIRDDDDNPPHWRAAAEYRKVVGRKNLLCTMQHPNEEKPEPIYFRVTKGGPQKDAAPVSSAVRSAAAVKGSVGLPKTYG